MGNQDVGFRASQIPKQILSQQYAEDEFTMCRQRQMQNKKIPAYLDMFRRMIICAGGLWIRESFCEGVKYCVLRFN